VILQRRFRGGQCVLIDDSLVDTSIFSADQILQYCHSWFQIYFCAVNIVLAYVRIVHTSMVNVQNLRLKI